MYFLFLLFLIVLALGVSVAWKPRNKGEVFWGWFFIFLAVFFIVQFFFYPFIK